MKRILLILLSLAVFSMSVSASQFARPDSDLIVGGWTVTPLWSKIDEAYPSNDGTTDRINSTLLSVSDANNMSLSDIGDPFMSSAHYLSYRYRKQGTGSGGQDNALRVKLFQGNTLIARYDHLLVSTTFVTANQTLTTAQADSITDYNNLKIEFFANGTATIPRYKLQVSWSQLQTPDSPLNILRLRGNGLLRIRGNGLLRIRG